MNILITGATGYIASHTILELLEKNHEIFALDNFSNSTSETLDKISKISKKNISFFECDITNKKNLEKVLSDVSPDIVIHFAGLKSVYDSIISPLDYYLNNFYGTYLLLTAMDKAGCTKIIFSSSATVYDLNSNPPFTEDDLIRPINPYGRSKLYVENMICDWTNACSKRKAISLRYFNPAGAHCSGLIGENPNGVPTNIMPLILEVASGKRDFLEVYGDDYDTNDGSCERDYIHVEDLAKAHVASLGALNHLDGNNFFNIGTGMPTSVFSLINKFKEITGVDIPFKVTERRPGDSPRSWADVKKANTILKWSAEKDIESIIKDSFNYISNLK